MSKIKDKFKEIYDGKITIKWDTGGVSQYNEEADIDLSSSQVITVLKNSGNWPTTIVADIIVVGMTSSSENNCTVKPNHKWTIKVTDTTRSYFTLNIGGTGTCESSKPSIFSKFIMCINSICGTAADQGADQGVTVTIGEP